MSQSQSSSSITPTDVALGAPITGFITFILLTLSSSLPDTSELKPFVSDESVSMIATVSSCVVTYIIALLRFLVGVCTIRFSFWVKKRSCYSILNDKNMSKIAKNRAQEQLDELASVHIQQVSSTNVN